VAPFRQREITGISCRLQSNSDTYIYLMMQQKNPLSVCETDLCRKPTCAKDWKNQLLLPSKYCLYVMSIAVVYYVGMRRKFVLLSFGETCPVALGLSSCNASRFILGKYSVWIPVEIQPSIR
jgi:hypothetical protein